MGCQSSHADRIGFFRFPLNDKNALEEWLKNLKNGLPNDFKLDEKDRRTVCAKHFQTSMIRSVGRGFRLAPRAVPNHINASPSSSPNQCMQPEEKRKVLNAKTPAQFILFLQRKILRLEDKLRRLKQNPPDSLILNHRYKLHQYMDRDAVILFESIIKNHNRTPSGRRHTSESKKLTSRIYHESRQTYHYIQPLFKLPSVRTIDGQETELSNYE